MHNARRLTRAFAILAAVSMAGCDDAPPETVERIRAIKPYYIIEPAGGDVRQYSGTIAASNTSALSFAASGTVRNVDVNQGDRVVEGQVLATLDTEPFDLDVEAAQSQVSAAEAEFDNQKVELDRQRQLHERGWVARARLDQAVAAFEAAKSQLDLSRTRLGIAERDLAQARLTAPFDGVISTRNVEPFTEISQGQTVFQVDSDDVFEVDLSIPDSVVGRLSIGAPVSVGVPTVPGCGCAGRITEIGASAGAANAVPVTATILEGPDGLLPGMAAQASVVLSNDDGPRGFLVPLVAIVASDENAEGYVFKFDATDGVVRKTPVQGDGSVSGNLIGVTVGVEAGDIIAAAGVSFLRDGQRVTLMGE
ncbi:MAG: efflux RND transporter periplasmic adaptor subunit [Inquilinus sp.]|nr:efflux RND transporter periplasmic adaptor subunit [Inquilinus sp.]